jgi:hypothetical protein
LIGNTLVPQQLAELVVITDERVGFAYCEYEFGLLYRFCLLFLMHIRNKLHGHIEVDVFSMKTIKKVPEIVYLTVQVVSPAHAYDFFEDTRMPHSQVYGMVCAHTATRNLKIVPVVFF